MFFYETSYTVFDIYILFNEFTSKFLDNKRAMLCNVFKEEIEKKKKEIDQLRRGRRNKSIKVSMSVS